MSISSLPSQPPLPLTPHPFHSDKASHANKPDQAPRQQNHESSSTGGIKTVSSSAPSAEVIATMNTIANLLNRDNLIQMMRNPYTKETAQTLKDLRALLSEHSLKSLSDAPKEQAQIKARICEVLSEENIRGLRKEAAALPIEALTPERIRQRTDKTDPEESYEASRQIEKELAEEKINTLHRSRHCEPFCNNLIAIGQLLNKSATHANAKLKPDTPAAPPTVKNAPQSLTPDSTQAPSDATLTREALTKMRRIGEILSRDSLIRMMREPNAHDTLRRMRELDTLLSDDSLKSLSPDPVEVEKLRALISQIMSEENLQSLLRYDHTLAVT